ncbi:MAG: (Fe-S)-binding protein [Promethearchaeota archaeon]
MSLESIRSILEKCVRCGKCRAKCPSLGANEIEKPNWDIFSPRGRILLSFGLLTGEIEPTETIMDSMFTCFICNQCVETCPSMTEVTRAIIETRRMFVENDIAPESVMDVHEIVDDSKNMFDMDQEERVELWSMDIDELIEDRVLREAKVLYYTGCQVSFKGTLANIPVKMVQILAKMGVDFTLLGEEEYCCGDPLELTGAPREEIKKLAVHNVEKIEELGVETVIFTCPGCYRMFKDVYPDLLERELKFKCQMASEYLLDKINDGAIQLHEVPGLGKVVYHDPCELGRHMHVYEPPRDIIKKIPGIEYVEFKNNRENSNCCGMGGGVAMYKMDFSTNQAKRKSYDIEESKADKVITHCPACYQGLNNAIEFIKDGEKEVKVLDLIELIALSMGITDDY